MPANVPHDVRAEQRFKMLLITVREKQVSGASDQSSVTSQQWPVSSGQSAVISQ